MFAVLGISGEDRGKIIKAAEDRVARGLLPRADRLLSRTAREMSVVDIRVNVFKYYLNVATNAVDSGDRLTFGDHRHYGTLCILASDLGISKLMGLGTITTFSHLIRQCGQHTFGTDTRSLKIRNRLLTTFFIGQFIANEKSVDETSLEMEAIPNGFHHDCVLAAHPISAHFCHDSSLPHLRPSYRSKLASVRTFNPFTPEQVLYNPLMKLSRVFALAFSNDGLSVVGGAREFIWMIVNTASSFQEVVDLLQRYRSIPFGATLDLFLTAVVARRLPVSARAVTGLIRAYAKMPRVLYSQGHENSWLYSIICFVTNPVVTISLDDKIAVFNGIFQLDKATDLLDVHFDCKESGVDQLRKVFIFTLLHVIDFNYAMDRVLLQRCEDGNFTTWKKESVWNMAKSLPNFRRFFKNSFSERFRDAIASKDASVLETLLPLYHCVREEIIDFSLAVPLRQTAVIEAKYCNRDSVPGLKSALLDDPYWKRLGLTSVLAGNTGPHKVKAMLKALDRFLRPAYEKKYGVLPDKRALYDSEYHGGSCLKRTRLMY